MTLVPSPPSYSIHKGDECGHGAAAYKQGVHGCFAAGSGFQILRLPFCENEAQTTEAIWKWRPIAWQPFGMPRWCMQHLSERQRPAAQLAILRCRGCMLYCYLGGGDHLCGLCLHPATRSEGQYGGPLKGGHQGGGGERLPIFHNHLWGGTTGLPPGSLWGTNVPPPITNGEHVFWPPHNCPLLLGNLPLQIPAQWHWQSPCPLWESNDDAICPTERQHHHSQGMKKPLEHLRSQPTTSQRNGTPLAKLLKGLARSHLKRLRSSAEGHPDFVVICLIHFGKWQILQDFSNWTYMKFRMHGWGGKISTLPIMLPRLHRKIYSTSLWWLQWNCKASWGRRGFIPQKPFAGRVATHIAHGVSKKGKMRGLWLTTSKQSIMGLGLVCALCLAFFTTSVDTMRKQKPHWWSHSPPRTRKRRRCQRRTTAMKMRDTSPRKS